MFIYQYLWRINHKQNITQKTALQCFPNCIQRRRWRKEIDSKHNHLHRAPCRAKDMWCGSGHDMRICFWCSHKSRWSPLVKASRKKTLSLRAYVSLHILWFSSLKKKKSLSIQVADSPLGHCRLHIIPTFPFQIPPSCFWIPRESFNRVKMKSFTAFFRNRDYEKGYKKASNTIYLMCAQFGNNDTKHHGRFSTFMPCRQGGHMHRLISARNKKSPLRRRSLFNQAWACELVKMLSHALANDTLQAAITITFYWFQSDWRWSHCWCFSSRQPQGSQ